MALLISTNMYRAGELKNVTEYLELFQGKIGVEIFPMFHEKGYEELLEECLVAFSKVPVSFHGPYYQAEHSAVDGTELYDRTMEMMELTMKYADRLNGRYVVFHHNNCKIDEGKADVMKEVSCMNYRRLREMYAPHKIQLLVENAGIRAYGNMLYNEHEFIELCRKENYPVLIDIGHANANGWNLYNVMEQLKDRIVAYHLHNNDGFHDGHRRIHDGTLNFKSFINAYERMTPQADLVVEYGLEVQGDKVGILEDIRLLSAYSEGR
ncbi:TIM barrel protein [Clostridium sp. AM58-1XD]|uniref:sugar phosphate isomerase/epimerase family protein n=1 Tax=Clostridium sp. AM58-1XD TaxID=2292307 RepID=UPI000E487F41|nr:TIM barrel protein [Clostridium sp. AM58-1XD]RGY98543.1 sugar phosphate isomerase/epimerase [Clostridium sp. AM58-1XD]